MQLKLAIAIVVVGRVAAAQAPGEAPPPAAPAETTSSDEPLTGTARMGYYSDSDRTDVLRMLTAVAKEFGQWSGNASFTIDAVTSASVDVKSSPLGAVDVVTSASGQNTTKGGEMSDTRTLGTAGVGWKDSDGHALNLVGAVASERDYDSLTGGLNGSYDVDDRTTTLLAGASVTDNWVGSVLDPRLHHKRFTASWSAGVAHVLTPDDALRLRYDGKYDSGYMASPYRNVRFGDWTTSIGVGGMIQFMNTLGSDAGLPEKLPQHRLANAVTLEWVHALWLGIGLHPSLRASYDSWGIASITPSLDARLVHGRWRFDVGYRYYAQTHANFYAERYTMDPSAYEFYTSDKELSREHGGVFSVDIVDILHEPAEIGGRRWLLTFHIDRADYAYRDFALLASRNSTFVQAGIGCEL